MGGRLPDVRVRRGRAALERGAPPVHRARRTATRTGSRPTPARCIAKAYDVVLNGIELGGGSVRIHREEVQSKVFRALKIGAEEARAEVRLPARRAAVRRAAARRHRVRARPLRHADDRRRVAARRDRVPEDAARAGLLTNAPSPVDEKQLRELHIRLRNTQAGASLMRRAAAGASGRARAALSRRHASAARPSRSPSRCWSSSTRRRSRCC